MIRDGHDLHALHPGAGGVIAKGGGCGEQPFPRTAIGLKHGVEGPIHPVEEAHLIGAEAALGTSQGRHHGLPQAVVLGVDRVLIRWDGTDGLQHPGARSQGVLVEIQPQQSPTALQWGAVGLQSLHIGASRGKGGTRQRGNGHGTGAWRLLEG